MGSLVAQFTAGLLSDSLCLMVSPLLQLSYALTLHCQRHFKPALTGADYTFDVSKRLDVLVLTGGLVVEIFLVASFCLEAVERLLSPGLVSRPLLLVAGSLLAFGQSCFLQKLNQSRNTFEAQRQTKPTAELGITGLLMLRTMLYSNFVVLANALTVCLTDVAALDNISVWVLAGLYAKQAYPKL